MQLRVGLGFDTHSIQKGSSLVLGGITISSPYSAIGHSDADVLIHAICDALLGAANLGDIGTHFPDTDEAYKGADSKDLLKEVVTLINNEGYGISNIDSTVVLEKPRIGPYIKEMKETLSLVLNVSMGDISIKATTSERLGFIGRNEGISAHAIALIQKKD